MIKKVCAYLIMVFLVSLAVLLPTYADNVIVQPGSGGNPGCGTGPLDTCYGATWRYYDWDGIKSGAYERAGIYYRGTNGSLEAEIAGYNPAGYNFNFANGMTINNCEGTDGVWRYAMVAFRSSNYTRNMGNGKIYRIYAGEQVGAIGIDGNGNNAFDSEFYGGGMNYIGNNDSDNFSWKRVRTVYQTWQREHNYAPPFDKVWGDNYDHADPIAVFCASNGVKLEYSANSGASNGTSWKQTEKVYKDKNPKAPVTVKTVTRTVQIGSATDFFFVHQAYANQSVSNKTTNWRLTRDFPAASGNYSLTKNERRSSGAVTFTNGSGNEYRPADLVEDALARDDYTITFNKTGTYEFCESLYLSNDVLGSNIHMTTACAVFNVVKEDETPPPSDVCRQWIPSSYNSSGSNSGTSTVVSKVRNNTLGESYKDSTYAKPTDNIWWIHCYYPGAQKVANTLITSKEGKHDSDLGKGGTTANLNDAKFYTMTSWSNSLSFYATNLRTPSPNSKSYEYGDSSIQSLKDETYAVEYGRGKNKAGKTLTEESNGKIASAKVYNDGKHSWACDYYTSQSCTHCEDEKISDTGCGCNTCAAGDTNCVVTCPSPCYICGTCRYSHSSCSHSNDYLLVDSSTGGTAKDHADVEIPYNFINTATISLSSGVVYAGETAHIGSSNVQVHTKKNDTTVGIYATHVEDAKVKFVAYLTNNYGGSAKTGVGSGKSYNICNALSGYEECDELDESDGNTFNEGGSLGLNMPARTVVASDSITDISDMSTTFNVYDTDAGKYYCVVAAVYPYTSGDDKNTSPSGSNNWYVSAPSCAIVAKKPSLQVWGSGLYTAGDVYVSAATKRVVSGYVGFSPKSSNKTTVFGSWVETGIIANGQVSGLASGASTGFPGNTSRTLVSDSNKLSGSKEGGTTRFCAYRSPLTMPNSGCLTSSGGLPGISDSGSVGSSTAKMNKPEDKDALISRFMTEDGTFKYINNIVSMSSFVAGYTGGSGVISAGQNQTYVIDASGKTFTIDRNIQYAENYNSFLDVPKLIIRANNINIKCNVTRVDAVLIADKLNGNSIVGNVNTCHGGGDDNSQARSTQLKINGAIVTGSLTAGRTYGAGTGAYSAVPAEIINYDSTLYLWGAPRADASSSGKLETVYVQELPPRL